MRKRRQIRNFMTSVMPLRHIYTPTGLSRGARVDDGDQLRDSTVKALQNRIY